MVWYVDGKLHRGGDLPAIIKPGICFKWYVNGHVHRDNDLPAIINIFKMPKLCNMYRIGDMVWYQHGQRHRSGGKPAIVTFRGVLFYFENGRRIYESPNGKEYYNMTANKLMMDFPYLLE